MNEKLIEFLDRKLNETKSELKEDIKDLGKQIDGLTNEVNVIKISRAQAFGAIMAVSFVATVFYNFALAFIQSSKF